MTLLALLIALAIERVVLPSARWQFVTYANVLFDHLANYQQTRSWFGVPLGVIGIAAIPSVLVWLLLELVEGAFLGFFSLLITVLVITISMGCLNARKAYKKFLRAARRGDEQACYIVADELGALAKNKPVRADDSATELPDDVELAVELLDEDENLEQQEQTSHCDLELGVGQTLAWVNYRYYIAIMIWLVVLGPVGVVFYATVRSLADREQNASCQSSAPQADIDPDKLDVDEDGEVTGLDEQIATKSELVMSNSAQQLLAWFDFVPVRIASLGLTLVGNFSQAMPVWLEHLVNTKESPKAHLVRLSLAAEEISDPGNPTCVASVSKFVEISKRNVLLVLSVIAVLTLYGSVS